MWTVITKIFSFGSTAFPAIPTSQLFYKSGKLVNSTNPVSLATNITLRVVECCCPPLLRLTSQCLSIVTLVGASWAFSNPTTIDWTVSLLSGLYFKCLE